MLHDLTIHAAADLLRAGDISSVQLTEALLDRITGVDNDVKAYLTLLPELALEQAAESDKAIAAARATAISLSLSAACSNASPGSSVKYALTSLSTP